MTLHILTTGGTFDKIYHDALSEFHIGDPMAPRLLQEAGMALPYQVDSLLRKDSLALNDEDRALIRHAVLNSPYPHILIIHGTDTMTQTAAVLRDIAGKVIVLTGAMQPARMRDTDAAFNLGMAVATAQTAAPGVYIAMSGQVFPANQVQKNRAAGRFELCNR